MEMAPLASALIETIGASLGSITLIVNIKIVLSSPSLPTDSCRNSGAHEISTTLPNGVDSGGFFSVSAKNILANVTALTVLLTASAPHARIETEYPSRIFPAIAPATWLGTEFAPHVKLTSVSSSSICMFPFPSSFHVCKRIAENRLAAPSRNVGYKRKSTFSSFNFLLAMAIAFTAVFTFAGPSAKISGASPCSHTKPIEVANLFVCVFWETFNTLSPGGARAMSSTVWPSRWWIPCGVGVLLVAFMLK
mmetsp:Transcript_6437/g.20215  ORF Transcript_6437/g.20215 Transcript_6437/m.20215 type:complete len:250 (+) Transcript_6437:3171-3920(+)